MINTFFTKSKSRSITNSSGANNSQINYILAKNSNLILVRNVEVFAGRNVSKTQNPGCRFVLKVNPSQPNILPSKRKGLLYKKGSSVTVLEN